MGRALSSIKTFLRQNPPIRQSPNSHIRNLSIESKETSQLCSDFAKEVCKIIRTKPRWEQTLLSDFPSFNFNDPKFFHQVLEHQNNVLLSLRYFYWLNSNYTFSADLDSCSALFDSLVEAKACKVAMDFLDHTGFSPDPGSIERYIQCLCECGLVQEAIGVLPKLKEMGVSGSIKTWNSALLGAVKVDRTDLAWKLYEVMIESDVVANVDAETVGYLIQAFCNDGKLCKGYQLLRQVLEEGLEPGNVAFNKLISGFCKKRNYGRVSELLHTMVARNCAPDRYTYQEVINGLCKSGMMLEGYRVFNDIKERGYAPDTVNYTTMIHGLWSVGQGSILMIISEQGYVAEGSEQGYVAEGSEQGYLAEGLQWFIEMLKSKLKPQKETFERLVQCLSQNDRLLASCCLRDATGTLQITMKQSRQWY
ncbi:hypothetical protein Patl1_25486 [Pistacia atlantica]|uniref:Uncharacterized protein n=1 Tax=Pistacia atlantica TaxID=434234 RepID=A0ACC1B007_9ROSI|nr:hypothetical protein Patl1_25486 [Pistacia atlantica]